MRFLRWTLIVPLCALVALTRPVVAEEPASRWQSFVEAVDSTTATALASPEAREKGWFSGAWDGTKRIWREGSNDLYLSGYVIHMPYAYTSEQREGYNNNAWGGGYGRTLTDEKSNQRMLWGLVAADSYDKPFYAAGYAWLARWPLGEHLRVGAGYSAFLIAHSKTTNYIPIPVVAPLASLGTDNAAIYMLYLYEVTYFVAKISFK